MHRNMWYGKAILAFVPSSSKKYWVPYPLSRRNPKSNNKSNLSAKKFSGMKHSPVQQMNNPNWWNTNSNMHPTTLHSLPQFLPSSDSSSSSSFCSSSSASPSFFHHYTLSNSLPVPYLHDHQDLTQPWSQLFSADVVGEHGERNFSQMEHKNAENWVDQVVFPSASVPISDVKQETTWHGNNFQTVLKSSLSEFLPAFSTRSSMMSSVSSIVNYNNRKAASHQLHHSSKCNKTGAGSTLKKARVQSATFKVRKEKLGDRIAALHQLVSPFGKTDTASVLLEATAYIRFHQRQIEALISSYLTSSAPSSCIRQPVVEGETRTDLKSRGLCLVPVNCTLQLCSNNAADYLSPSFGGGFG